MATYRLTLLTLPLAAATIAIGACGGGDPEATAGTGDQQAKFREAALKFTRCMREHGVDMPDPQPGQGGGMMFRGPGGGPGDQAKMESAQKACQKYLEDVRPPELSKEQEARFKDLALKFARCMRAHGLDFPDPTFGAGGRMTQRFEGGPGEGPEDPRFREAQQECSKYQPKLGRVQSAN
jgi:hypothetical protein